MNGRNQVSAGQSVADCNGESGQILKRLVRTSPGVTYPRNACVCIHEIGEDYEARRQLNRGCCFSPEGSTLSRYFHSPPPPLFLLVSLSLFLFYLCVLSLRF